MSVGEDKRRKFLRLDEADSQGLRDDGIQASKLCFLVKIVRARRKGRLRMLIERTERLPKRYLLQDLERLLLTLWRGRRVLNSRRNLVG